METTTTAAGGFVHLHVHTEHSKVDSTARLTDLISTAASMGQEAVAVTDHGWLGALFEAHHLGRESGVKVISGLEAYVAIGSRHRRDVRLVPVTAADADGGGRLTREPRRDAAGNEVIGPDGRVVEDVFREESYDHLTILALTERGHRNLVALHNASWDSHWQGKPRIDLDLLRERREGLLILTGCLGGPVLGPLARGDEAGARAGIETLIDAVGREQIYVEVMEHEIPSESAVLPRLVELAGEYGLPIVATNDLHHVHADGAQAHEAWLIKGQKDKTLLDEPGKGRWVFPGKGYHLRTADEMRALRPEPWWQTACDNTLLIAAQAQAWVLPTPKFRMPDFPLVPQEFADQRRYYLHLVKEGAQRKYALPDGTLPQEVRDRLNREDGVVHHFGAEPFALYKWYILRWARENGIVTGRGRGSAASSAASYCLDIVHDDPLRSDLLFERYMDTNRGEVDYSAGPHKISMGIPEAPDIDSDFGSLGLSRVLTHMVETFGDQMVARIGSHRTSATRASVKTAARLLGRRDRAGDELASLVPIAAGQPWSFALLDKEREDGARPFWEAVERFGADDVIALARQFEDVVEGPGVHASGVLVADEPMTELVPLRLDIREGQVASPMRVTEWEHYAVQAMGFLKLDFLGLRNLDIIDHAVRNVRTLTGERLDYLHLPDPDDVDNPRVRAAHDLIAAGRTAGLFQIESSGMTELAAAAKPESLEEYAALVALYRPGPLKEGMHHDYVARKHGRAPVDYDTLSTDPAEQEVLRDVLGPTFGLLIYQESWMHLGDRVAGFSPEERTQLRKAVSKKKQAILDAMEERFVAGALRDVHHDGTPKVAFSEGTARRVWKIMAGGADYAFNKAHSVSYGHTSFVTAYLKANWPSAYAAAVLACTDDDDKRLPVLQTIEAEGIEVLPPDINASSLNATPVDDTHIALGLSDVKKLGGAQAIVDERDRVGPYASLADVMRRVTRRTETGTKRVVDAGVAQAIVESGAADDWGTRLGQVSILDALQARPETPPLDQEWGVLGKAVRQQQRLGLILGRHPLASLGPQLRQWHPEITDSYGNPLGIAPQPLRHVAESGTGTVVTIGLVTGWKVSPTKKGGMKGEITLSGSGAIMHGIVFGAALRSLDRQPTIGSVVGVQARIESTDVEQQAATATTEVDDDGNLLAAPAAPAEKRRKLLVSKIWVLDIADVDQVEASAEAVLDISGMLWSPSTHWTPPTPPRGPETVADPVTVPVESIIDPDAVAVDELAPVRPDLRVLPVAASPETEESGEDGWRSVWGGPVVVVPDNPNWYDTSLVPADLRTTYRLLRCPADLDDPSDRLRLFKVRASGGEPDLLVVVPPTSGGQISEVPGHTPTEGNWAPTHQGDWFAFAPHDHEHWSAGAARGRRLHVVA